jgi:uncharacterized Zn-binding protein involved in type VI secretion
MMLMGYYINQGDKTTCGGQVLDGDPTISWDGLSHALEGHRVSCGKDGKVYKICGGDPTFTNMGISVAGTLDSFSGCPCRAQIIPTILTATYSREVSAPLQAGRAATQPVSQPDTRPESNPQVAGLSPESKSATSATSSGSSSIPTTRASLTPELIAVAGSQHDSGSGNKMMFIAQAVRELAEFKRSKPDLSRTLVVFTPAYNDAMLSAARASAENYGAGFVEVTTAEELIDYLNQGKNRERSPIEHLCLFSHGIPHQVAFGYELAGGYRLALNVLNYREMSPSAFSSTARLDSYACRTGMGNRSEYPVEDGIQFFPQTNESLAQLLADHLRIKVRAFVRRSDYKNTWGSFRDRQRSKSCKVNGSAVPHEAWCKRWKELESEREKYNASLKFTYQSAGATKPVISGDTPVGAPGGQLEFLPK